MNQTPNEITDCALLGCLCKCHVEDEEDPGPHLSTCFWSDPEFPRAKGLAVLEGGADDDRAMLHGHTPPRGTELGRLVGAERGAVPVLPAGPAAIRVDNGPWVVQPGFEQCPWVKVAGTDQQVRCARAVHNDSEDESTKHDWSGPLEPRTPITVSTKYVGAWDPREQPGARIELTEEQVRDFSGATAAALAASDAAIAKLTLPASMIGGPDVRPRRVPFDPRGVVGTGLSTHPISVDRLVGEPVAPNAIGAAAAAPFVDARHRPWFLTLTGRQFFYDDPEAYPFSIGEIAHALSNLCRFAGHLATFYSVAEHSVLVARALAMEAWRTLEYPGDIRRLLRASLIHDASEAFLMDLPRPLKRLPGLEGYRILEDRVQLAIERRFGLEGHHDAVCVKRADAAVLVAEKRQLRPPHLFGERGDITDGQTPADVTCRSLPPRLAREFFLDTWHELGGE